MNRMRMLFFLLIPLPVFAGCHHAVQEVHAPETVTGLQVAAVRAARIPDTSPAVGTVQAKESASLSAQIVGRVTAVFVHEGDGVRAGQVLVRLDAAQAHAGAEQAHSTAVAAQHQLEAAKAQAALAASTLARYQMLREQKSVSPQEFDEVARRAEETSAQLAAARANLEAQNASASAASILASYAAVAAPFAGIVTARHVDPGALASPGVPLIDIDRSGPLQLVVTVNESLLQRIQSGSVLPVSVPAADSNPFIARVAQILPAADAASHSFVVKLDLPSSPHLKAGMYGTASLGASTRPAVFAPQTAIVAHGSIHSVWVIDPQGIPSLRYVSIGSQWGPDVEILSGLSAGERVVLSPGDRELGGSRIGATP